MAKPTKESKANLDSNQMINNLKEIKYEPIIASKIPSQIKNIVDSSIKKNTKSDSKGIVQDSNKEAPSKPLKIVPNVSLTTYKDKSSKSKNTEEENSKVSLTETSHRLLSVAQNKMEDSPSSESCTISPIIKRFSRSDAFISLGLTNDKAEKEVLEQYLNKTQENDDSESTENVFQEKFGRKNNANDKKDIPDNLGDKQVVQSLKTKIKYMITNDEKLIAERLRKINFMKKKVNKNKSRPNRLFQDVNKDRTILKRSTEISSGNIDEKSVTSQLISSKLLEDCHDQFLCEIGDSVNPDDQFLIKNRSINSKFSIFLKSESIQQLNFQMKNLPISKSAIISELISNYKLKPIKHLCKTKLKSKKNKLKICQLPIMQIEYSKVSMLILIKNFENLTIYQIKTSKSLMSNEENNDYDFHSFESIIYNKIFSRINEKCEYSTEKQNFIFNKYIMTNEYFIEIMSFSVIFPCQLKIYIISFNNFSFQFPLQINLNNMTFNENKSVISDFESNYQYQYITKYSQSIKFVSEKELFMISQNYTEKNQIDKISLEKSNFVWNVPFGYQIILKQNLFMSLNIVKVKNHESNVKSYLTNKFQQQKILNSYLSNLDEIRMETVDKLNVPEIIVSHCDFQNLADIHPENLHEKIIKVRHQQNKLTHVKHIVLDDECNILCPLNKKKFRKAMQSLKTPRVKLLQSDHNHYCEICNKCFLMKVTLRQHFRTHKKRKPCKTRAANNEPTSYMLLPVYSKYNNEIIN